MSLYSFYRISKPSAEQVAPEKVDGTYRSLRNRTFWGVTVAYSLYYVCRTSLNVMKKPIIDSGVLDAAELGVISSTLLFVYAIGNEGIAVCSVIMVRVVTIHIPLRSCN